jgi:hypothetical protein
MSNETKHLHDDAHIRVKTKENGGADSLAATNLCAK